MKERNSAQNLTTVRFFSIGNNVCVIKIMQLLLVYCSLSLLLLSAFKILTGKPTGKRPLGRPRRRLEDNIRMDFEDIDGNAGNWVDSAQDWNYWRALVNAALNLRVP